LSISLATVNDIPELIKLSKALHQLTIYKQFNFNESKVEGLLKKAITGDVKDGLVLVSWDLEKINGLLGALVMEPMYSTDKLASEWVWWVDPSCTNSKKKLVKLLEGYEYWAKNVAKCKAILVGRMYGFDNSENYLKRKGYTLSEKAYLKELY
jgi:hypothetical protein